MSDQNGLLQAIVESPLDDAPRLIYADWLEEHGQERHARFIRTQCALPRMTLGPDPRLYGDTGGAPADAVEIREVLPSLRPALLAPFLPLVPQLPLTADTPVATLSLFFRFMLRHGFIEGLTVLGNHALEALLEQADTALTFLPLQELTVTSHHDHPNGYPTNDSIRLHFLERLLALPVIERIRRLELLNVSLGERGAEILLAAHPRLRLETLRLSGHLLPTLHASYLTELYGPTLDLGPTYEDIPF